MSPSYRLRLALPVEATVDGFPAPLPATVIDLSIGGCRLTAGSILLTGSGIRFHLRVDGKTIPVSGKIRHNDGGSAGSLEYGIEFAKLPAEQSAILERFLEEERVKNAAVDNAVRVETEFDVACTVAGKKDSFKALAIDLSRGGLRLAHDKRIPEGTVLNMQVSLPNAGAGRPLQVRGKVMQASQQFREFHHSVVFIEVSAGFGDEMERVVRALRLGQH